MAKCLLEPVGVHVAAAVGADRPFGEELCEGADRLRHWYGVVHRVGEIEIDGVNAEALQAGGELPPDASRGKPGVGALAHRVERLRRQHDPLAYVGTLLTQPAAEIRLAAAAAVGVGGVVGRDPGVPGGIEQRMRLILGLARAEERRRRADPAEVAAAEDDPRHVDAAAAERTVLHWRDATRR